MDLESVNEEQGIEFLVVWGEILESEDHSRQDPFEGLDGGPEDFSLHNLDYNLIKPHDFWMRGCN
eukprot:CAMPEP_0116905772 /NCGR_PEP_ID=MMETSP0467-20121206/12157_1 /TAXON_ID=283647 /ORGANISM="Mesodinium pulex, Strain SPMC105" /LENGTH=64 /DNA_ID=CAMNT_0004580559 /DNA_START=291 /DNA_END=485 /DNA_ORIENTATION=-